MKKSQKQEVSSKDVNKYKITPSINYPDYRSKKGNVAIPSQNNVEISRNWIEINKL